jgi:hypothetical protein
MAYQYYEEPPNNNSQPTGSDLDSRQDWLVGGVAVSSAVLVAVTAVLLLGRGTRASSGDYIQREVQKLKPKTIQTALAEPELPAKPPTEHNYRTWRIGYERRSLAGYGSERAKVEHARNCMERAFDIEPGGHYRDVLGSEDHYYKPARDAYKSLSRTNRERFMRECIPERSREFFDKCVLVNALTGCR